jgi:hypothetical protein
MWDELRIQGSEYKTYERTFGRDPAIYLRAYCDAVSVQDKEQLLHVSLSLHFITDINKRQRTLCVAT